MKMNQISMGNQSPMLNVYLYDTNSVQDRLFQRSQSSEVEATTDDNDKNLPQESNNENESNAENSV